MTSPQPPAVVLDPAPGPDDIQAAAALWVAVDEARAGQTFTLRYAAEQRAGFVETVARPDAWLVVARADGEVVGLVGGFPAEESDAPDSSRRAGYLAWIAVTPARWGDGTAHALMSGAEDRQRATYDEMLLWTHTDNGRGRRFYERRGWMLTGATMRTPVGDELVQYRLALRPTPSAETS